MISTKVYGRVMMALTDHSIEEVKQLGVFDDPQATVDNANQYWEYVQRQIEVSEWMVAYFHGQAIHEEVVRNPGESYMAVGARLELSRHATVLGVRVYKLFRDRPLQISKLHGLLIRELTRLSATKFEATLDALNNDFPLAPLPELELEF
ncbi:MAG TPA: hypothetical protein VM715_06085 [Candidatus Acidoferrum sp.]|nr:hypothetical protein [Candidatus Acidoferrum sp.]